MVKITTKEIEILKLKDLYELSDEKCIKELNISKKEFEKELKNIRKKIYHALLDKENFEIVENKENVEEKTTTLCKFRCAVCGSVYDINYTKEKILCPLCLSSEVIDV